MNPIKFNISYQDNIKSYSRPIRPEITLKVIECLKQAKELQAKGDIKGAQILFRAAANTGSTEGIINFISFKMETNEFSSIPSLIRKLDLQSQCLLVEQIGNTYLNNQSFECAIEFFQQAANLRLILSKLSHKNHTNKKLCIFDKQLLKQAINKQVRGKTILEKLRQYTDDKKFNEGKNPPKVEREFLSKSDKELCNKLFSNNQELSSENEQKLIDQVRTIALDYINSGKKIELIARYGENANIMKADKYFWSRKEIYHCRNYIKLMNTLSEIKERLNDPEETKSRIDYFLNMAEKSTEFFQKEHFYHIAILAGSQQALSLLLKLYLEQKNEHKENRLIAYLFSVGNLHHVRIAIAWHFAMQDYEKAKKYLSKLIKEHPSMVIEEDKEIFEICKSQIKTSQEFTKNKSSNHEKIVKIKKLFENSEKKIQVWENLKNLCLHEENLLQLENQEEKTLETLELLVLYYTHIAENQDKLNEYTEELSYAFFDRANQTRNPKTKLSLLKSADRYCTQTKESDLKQQIARLMNRVQLEIDYLHNEEQQRNLRRHQNRNKVTSVKILQRIKLENSHTELDNYLKNNNMSTIEKIAYLGLLLDNSYVDTQNSSLLKHLTRIENEIIRLIHNLDSESLHKNFLQITDRLFEIYSRREDVSSLKTLLNTFESHSVKENVEQINKKSEIQQRIEELILQQSKDPVFIGNHYFDKKRYLEALSFYKKIDEKNTVLSPVQIAKIGLCYSFVRDFEKSSILILQAKKSITSEDLEDLFTIKYYEMYDLLNQQEHSQMQKLGLALIKELNESIGTTSSPLLIELLKQVFHLVIESSILNGNPGTYIDKIVELVDSKDPVIYCMIGIHSYQLSEDSRIQKAAIEMINYAAQHDLGTALAFLGYLEMTKGVQCIKKLPQKAKEFFSKSLDYLLKAQKHGCDSRLQLCALFNEAYAVFPKIFEKIDSNFLELIMVDVEQKSKNNSKISLIHDLENHLKSSAIFSIIRPTTIQSLDFVYFIQAKICYKNSNLKEASELFNLALQKSSNKNRFQYEIYIRSLIDLYYLSQPKNRPYYFQKILTEKQSNRSLPFSLEPLYLDMGNIFMQFKKNEEAKKYFLPLIEGNDGYYTCLAYTHLAKIDFLDKKHKEALRHCIGGIQSYTDFKPDTNLTKSHLDKLKSSVCELYKIILTIKNEEIESLLKKFVKSTGEEKIKLAKQGLILSQACLSYKQDLVKLDSNNNLTFLDDKTIKLTSNISMFHYTMGNYLDGIEASEKLLNSSDFNQIDSSIKLNNFYYNLSQNIVQAILMQKLLKKDKILHGINYIQKAIELNPDEIMLRNNLSYIYGLILVPQYFKKEELAFHKKAHILNLKESKTIYESKLKEFIKQKNFNKLDASKIEAQIDKINRMLSQISLEE